MAEGGLPGTKLFVGCLPYSKSEDDVANLFGQFGPLVEVAMLKDKLGSSKGAAFVSFEYPEHAEVATQSLMRYTFPGSTRAINISVAGAKGSPQSAGGVPSTRRALIQPAGGSPSSANGSDDGFGGGYEDTATAAHGYGAGGGGDGSGAANAGGYDGYGGCCNGGYGGCCDGYAGMYQGYAVPVQPSVSNVFVPSIQGYAFAGVAVPGQPSPSATYPKGSAPAPPGRPPPPHIINRHANGKGRSSPSNSLPGTKLFVGQLPFSRSETDLWQLFGTVGSVTDVVLHRNRETNEKKGAAFVRFQSPHEADRAIIALDGHFFDGSTRPITVNYANERSDDGTPRPSLRADAAHGQHSRLGPTKRPLSMVSQSTRASPRPAQTLVDPDAKLFVGQLPFSRTEQDLETVFAKYGPVAEVILLRNGQNQKTGAGFVKFFSVADATQALEADGFLFDGSTRPITVSLASVSGRAAKARRFL